MTLSYLIGLRLFHVLASVAWAGGGFVTFFFLEPTAKSLAPTGMEFLGHMADKGRFNITMVVASTLTVLSGALLLWQDGGGQWLPWIQTGPGLGFALGSIVGIAVYGVGMLGVGPQAAKLSKLGNEIKESGAPPTPEQAAQMEGVAARMAKLSKIDFWMVALSLALMGTARYWLF